MLRSHLTHTSRAHPDFVGTHLLNGTGWSTSYTRVIVVGGTIGGVSRAQLGDARARSRI